MITNDAMPVNSDQQVLWDQNGPTSSSLSIEETDEATRCLDMLDDLTRFEVASPLLHKVKLEEILNSDDLTRFEIASPLLYEVKLEEILNSEDVVLNIVEEGQFSGAKRKLASEKKVFLLLYYFSIIYK